MVPLLALATAATPWLSRGRARTETGKDAGRRQWQRHGGDRGRRQAKVRSRPRVATVVVAVANHQPPFPWFRIASATALKIGPAVGPPNPLVRSTVAAIAICESSAGAKPMNQARLVPPETSAVPVF